jgi:hypothetical protein
MGVHRDVVSRTKTFGHLFKNRAAAGGEMQVASLLRQNLGDRRTDTPGRAGDNGRTSGQLQIQRSLLLVPAEPRAFAERSGPCAGERTSLVTMVGIAGRDPVGHANRTLESG